MRLAFLSFLESTVVPVPIETAAGPVMAAYPARAYRVATYILGGCLIGAAMFYLIAFFLIEPLVEPALAWLGLEKDFREATERLDRGAFFWAVFLVSATPLPFQLATLGAGAVSGHFAVFMAAVALSRALRYYGLAFLARRYGPAAVRFFGGSGNLVFWGTMLLICLYGLLQLLL